MVDPVAEYDFAVTNLRRAVDGDTFDLTLTKNYKFAFYLEQTMSWTMRFRLLGINAPETNQAGGAAATARATEWLTAAIAAGVCRGESHKADNFGRWLITLYRTDNAENLTLVLISEGLGVVYTGRT